MRMKAFFAIFLVVAVFIGCNRAKDPTGPQGNGLPTVDATQTATVAATQTATVQAQQTATVQAQQTATVQAQQTATATATVTVTVTATATATATVDLGVLVSVPGGTYTQTDVSGNSFQHTISAFRIGKYEVTYELWYEVRQWALQNGYTFANNGREGSNGTRGLAPTSIKYEPVTEINWRDAIVWCNAYSQKSGLTPVYCSDAGFTTPIKASSNDWSINTTPGSVDNPHVNWNASGYRLPTEGEWQYAASYKDGVSWTPHNYASGATAGIGDLTATGLVAWYSGNSGGITKNVGRKNANALGIHDMSGNVLEWCYDWHSAYPGTPTNNYRGPASGFDRVLRGGYYSGDAANMRVGLRLRIVPNYMEASDSGFRLVRKE